MYIALLCTLEFYFSSLCSIYFSFFYNDRRVSPLLRHSLLPSSLVFCHMHIRTHTLCTVSSLVQRLTGRSVSYQLAFVLDVCDLTNGGGIFIPQWDPEETRKWTRILKEAFERVRENSFSSLGVHDLLVKSWIHFFHRSLIVSTIDIYSNNLRKYIIKLTQLVKKL